MIRIGKGFCGWLVAGLELWLTGSMVAEVCSIDVAPVWAGHPVGFGLLTHGDQQFVAFYDADRQMTLAQRTLGNDHWKFKKLETRVEWDSHNSVTLELDRENYLHVSGNMHRSALTYFRGTRPLDIGSVEPVHRMTGQLETEVTYPVFLKGKDGEMIFSYRDGQSGDGETIYNIYDEKSRTWRRLTETALFDGEGQMSAYPVGPKRGDDGWFHLTWIWRDTSLAETNHDLCYARSRDLVAWESADGKPVELPIRPGSSGVSVDPVPVNGGILNGSGKVGFDPEGRVVITYHKFDDAGMTQLYLARFEDGAWRARVATAWTYRWEIAGGGSLAAEISHGEIITRDGRMSLRVSHVKEGGGTFEVDPLTWKLKGKLERPVDEPVLPAALKKVGSAFPGMKLNWRTDGGKAMNGKSYRLRWETLGPNRDRPRPEPWPKPEMLKLVEISAD